MDKKWWLLILALLAIIAGVSWTAAGQPKFSELKN